MKVRAVFLCPVSGVLSYSGTEFEIDNLFHFFVIKFEACGSTSI
jgi:hypothetical protein